MKDKIAISVVLVSAAYIAAQMMADITSLKILLIAGFSIDGGTLVYPFTFTIRDMLHKIAGAKATRVLIVAAGVINLVMAGMFWLVSVLPGDPSAGEQAAFAMALMPVWRIVIASIVAEVIAELVDTEAYHLWVTRVTPRYQWARVLVSNAVSVPLDSFLFSWIAFFGVLPDEVVFSIFLSNMLVKGLVTVVSLPGIYAVKDRHEDGTE